MSRRVSPDALEVTIQSLFEAVGMNEGNARTMAEALVFTDLRGVYSHGSAKVGNYLGWLVDGEVDAQAEPVLISHKGATAVVDAANSLGHIACAFAMQQAVEIAREVSIGVVAVSNSNHCGALAYYPEIAMRAGMIGIAMTNALPTMAPWGGVDRIVGINPVSIGFPGGSEQHVLLDTSFGVVARGKIMVRYENGLDLPEGWAFDAAGHPTTDAAAAMAGLNQPIGGAKGVGLGIAFGMLPALLASAAYGSRLGDLATGPLPGRDGQLMVAIDVAAFTDLEGFRAMSDEIVQEIHQSRRMEGVDRLYVPGEIESDMTTRYLREGIPIDNATHEQFRHWTDRLGVSAPWLEGA
jgi:ureidoglycolate dehydrogenase (NAD+)